MRRRIFTNSLICLLCLLCLVYVLPGLAAVQIPVIHVDTRDKSAFEIGKTLGRQVKRQFPNIEQLYDAYLATVLSQEKFAYWHEERVRVITAGLDQAYRDEVLGITSVWQISSHDQLGDGYLSLNEYWTFLLAPDIGIRIGGSGFGVWNDASRSGYPIVGRNLDWVGNEPLRSLQAITVYLGETHGLVNIGFAGFIGVISGFNQGGLFLAHIDSPMLGQSFSANYAPGSVVFDIRKVLETENRIAHAEDYFTDIEYSASHSILLADNYDIQVLEQPPGQDAQVRRDRSAYRVDKAWPGRYQIAAVNCFTLLRSPDNCYDMRDNFRWDRFRDLANFSASNPAEVRSIIDVMFDHLHDAQAIYNPRTLQAMVFEPKARNLHLYSMPISGRHEAGPRMSQLNGLLSDIPDDAFDWLSTLNIAIFFTLLVLIVALIYGEFAKKRR